MSPVLPLALHLALAAEGVPVGAERVAGLAGILAAFWEAGAGRRIELEPEGELHAPYRVVVW